MIRRFLLVIVLLAALVAVVYLKFERDRAVKREAYTMGYDRGHFRAGVDTVALREAYDAEVAELREHLIDSLSVLGDTPTAQVDSLLHELILRDSSISDLETRLADAKASARKAAEEAKAAGTASSGDVIAHYKRQVEELPGDLSDYERNVALREIRQETAQRFSITLVELESLRTRNGLDY